MGEKAGLATKFTNHSGRKTMTQTLVSFGKPKLSTNRHYSTVGPQEPAKRHSLFHCQRESQQIEICREPSFSRRCKPKSFV